MKLVKEQVYNQERESVRDHVWNFMCIRNRQGRGRYSVWFRVNNKIRLKVALRFGINPGNALKWINNEVS